MKNTTILIIFLFCSNITSAVHIIGGSMTYENLGNDIYKINLEVLRDCSGNGAAFDNPAHLGIYSGGTFIQDVELYLDGSPEQVSNNLPDNICDFSISICIEKYVYETTLNLPDMAAGYDLSYQRCCRSAIMLNLNDPEISGMTFHTHINTSIGNSSPIFSNNIPLGIFAGTPFLYDASVSDPDGDSLAYRLVSPFVGGGINGTPMNPGDPNASDGVQPIPPSGPPFNQISFLEPYSIDNMLGGNYPLQIHPETGQMSAVPPSLGVFQIAYAIDEYRDGELVGTTYREFAFVVISPLPNQVYNVSGTVFINGNIPLDNGKVQIMERNLATDLFSIYDEQNIGTNGEYSFSNIPSGLFYIKGIPGENSIYINDYLPTYYDSSAFWYSGVPLNQCDTSDVYRDIHLVPVNNPSGQVIFEGTVSQPENGNQIAEGLNLILKNENDEFIQIQTTNASGYFKFEGLENGNYLLYADLINSNIYNETPPSIELGDDLDTEVYLYDTTLSLSLISSIPEESKKEYRVYIRPNPTNNVTTLEMDINEEGNYTMEILDIYGRNIRAIIKNEYLGQGIFSREISMSGYASGVYFIAIQHKGNQIIKKIVKYQ